MNILCRKAFVIILRSPSELMIKDKNYDQLFSLNFSSNLDHNISRLQRNQHIMHTFS